MDEKWEKLAPTLFLRFLKLSGKCEKLGSKWEKQVPVLLFRIFEIQWKMRKINPCASLRQNIHVISTNIHHTSKISHYSGPIGLYFTWISALMEILTMQNGKRKKNRKWTQNQHFLITSWQIMLWIFILCSYLTIKWVSAFYNSISNI